MPNNVLVAGLDQLTNRWKLLLSQNLYCRWGKKAKEVSKLNYLEDDKVVIENNTVEGISIVWSYKYKQSSQRIPYLENAIWAKTELKEHFNKYKNSGAGTCWEYLRYGKRASEDGRWSNRGWGQRNGDVWEETLLWMRWRTITGF